MLRQVVDMLGHTVLVEKGPSASHCASESFLRFLGDIQDAEPMSSASYNQT